MKNSRFSSPFPMTINHLYFLFLLQASQPTAGAAIIVRALGHLGLPAVVGVVPRDAARGPQRQ
jgi:hypothetical protein